MNRQICNCCGASSFPLGYIDQFQGKALVECDACRHIQLQEGLTAQQLRNFYAGAYSEDRGKYVDAAYAGIMIRRANTQFNFVSKQLDLSGVRVCDYGAGYGYLVERFWTGGVDCFGYEADNRCIAAAKDRGVDLRPTPERLDEKALDGARVVLMSHVLEHLLDPVAFLNDVKAYLDYLFIEVPAYSSAIPQQFDDQEGHVNFFNRESLLKLLEEKASLRLMALESCGPSLQRHWGNGLAARLANKFERTVTGDWFCNRYGPSSNGMWLRALVATR